VDGKNGTTWSKISGMQAPITERFSAPPKESAKPSKSSKGDGPHKISIIFLPIYLPLLFIAGAISIPWSHVSETKTSPFREKIHGTDERGLPANDIEGISSGAREWTRNSYRRDFVHQGTISALVDGRKHPGS
jgi:hypothetical protein